MLTPNSIPFWRLCPKTSRGESTWKSLIIDCSKLIIGVCSKDAATNPRGIPYAPFVDKVEDYVSSRAEVDTTMKSFQEMISYGETLVATCGPC